MIIHLINLLKSLGGGNQFLSGGLVLGFLGGAVVYLKSLPGKLWKFFLRTFTVSMDVMNTDEMYRYTLKWMNSQSYVGKARRVSLKALRAKPVIVPSHGNHFFLWHRRPVWLNWEDEAGKAGASTEFYMQVTREKITIKILGRDRKLIDNLVEEMKDLQKVNESGKSKVYRRVRDDWSYELRHPRQLSTVFLPKDGETLLDDMKTFLGRESWYRERGVPYRRGYLFYGPPGNGKSSVALALANHLNIPLYVLNLATMAGDGILENAIRDIDTSTPLALLIEDIDTAVPDRNLDKTKKPFSLGTLLNAMDGVAARENLILIATTNDKDALDPALIRPGRMDKIVEFTNATQEQIRAAVKLYGKPELEAELLAKAGSISMAEVQERLLKE